MSTLGVRSLFPTVEQHRVELDASDREQVRELARALVQEQPELALPERFRNLVLQEADPGSTLHLDDQSGIRQSPAVQYDTRCIQDRARLRAESGDLVASCASPPAGYEWYCCEMLGLGEVEWLFLDPGPNTRRVAVRCWQDRAVRRRLVHDLREGRLATLHPLMGAADCWELAGLLSHSARVPLRVLGPPPGLTRAVNDKTWFARMAARLLGTGALPETYLASNLALLCARVRDLAESHRAIGIKIPDTAGGEGNLVLHTARFRGRRLARVRQLLAKSLGSLGWRGGSPLVVMAWETDVLMAPAVQLWMPAEPGEPPIVEGIFEQILEGREGHFTGNRPAQLSAELQQAILAQVSPLAMLLQDLGYVGRCSFDLIVVGHDQRPQLIEINGRWGGASYPMTLMNRLFGDWRSRPFVSLSLSVPGLERVPFERILECLSDELYDTRTGRGDLILFSPSFVPMKGQLCLIMLQASPRDIGRRKKEITDRLHRLVRPWELAGDDQDDAVPPSARPERPASL